MSTKIQRFQSFQIEPHERDRKFYVVGFYDNIKRQCVGECRTRSAAEALLVKLNRYHFAKSTGGEE